MEERNHQLTNRHLEGVPSRQPSKSKEIRAVVLDDEARKNLASPTNHGDFRPTEVCSLKAIKITPLDSQSILLQPQRLVDHGQRLALVNNILGRGTESPQRRLSLNQSVLPSQPPWRLWGEHTRHCEGERPYPLDGERDSVGPLVVHVDHACKDPGGDQMADDPAEVDVGCEVWLQDGGGDFRDVA